MWIHIINFEYAAYHGLISYYFSGDWVKSILYILLVYFVGNIFFAVK